MIRRPRWPAFTIHDCAGRFGRDRSRSAGMRLRARGWHGDAGGVSAPGTSCARDRWGGSSRPSLHRSSDAPDLSLNFDSLPRVGLRGRRESLQSPHRGRPVTGCGGRPARHGPMTKLLPAGEAAVEVEECRPFEGRMPPAHNQDPTDGEARNERPCTRCGRKLSADASSAGCCVARCFRTQLAVTTTRLYACENGAGPAHPRNAGPDQGALVRHRRSGHTLPPIEYSFLSFSRPAEYSFLSFKPFRGDLARDFLSPD